MVSVVIVDDIADFIRNLLQRLYDNMPIGS